MIHTHLHADSGKAIPLVLEDHQFAGFGIRQARVRRRLLLPLQGFSRGDVPETKVSALILPTRELVQQVDQLLAGTAPTPIFRGAVYGGNDDGIRTTGARLKAGCQYRSGVARTLAVALED